MMRLIRDVFTFTVHNPTEQCTYSICHDHVDYEVFKEAFKKDGRYPGVVFMRDALAHEWWIRKSPTVWVRAVKGDAGALPVTVLRW